MESAINKAESDEGIKVVVIRGAGGNFSAGADLKYLSSILEEKEQLISFIKQINRAFFCIEDSSLPTIAIVEGYALAGGFELMLCCDFVIAADNAKIGDQHINYALIPGGGGSQRLPRQIGILKAKEILMTGTWLDAYEAEKFGLVNKVASIDKLDDACLGLLESLTTKSPIALKNIKHLINQGLQMNKKNSIDLEEAIFHNHMNSNDAKMGLSAFLNKKSFKF